VTGACAGTTPENPTGGGGITPQPIPGGDTVPLGYCALNPTSPLCDPSQPDQGSLNDPLWVPDYQNNPALVGLTPTQQCTRFNDTPGWYGRYFDYPSNHPDMEMSSNWDKSYGDPLSTQKTWTADWYDAKYFRFAKSSSNLEFGSHFFPFDYAPEQFIAGHAYYFGVEWSSEVTAPVGDYAFRLVSDDDSWLYVNGRLVSDNSGVHGAITKTGLVHLNGTELVQIFFAERHTTDSHFYFAFSPDSNLTFTAHYSGCDNIPKEPTGSIETPPIAPPILPEQHEIAPNPTNPSPSTPATTKRLAGRRHRILQLILSIRCWVR